MTVVVWQTTQSSLLGILGGILADIVATAPMVIKSWKDPKDEPIFPWAVFAFGSSVNLFAVDEWVIKYWLFPVYMTAMGTLITIPLILYYYKKGTLVG